MGVFARLLRRSKTTEEASAEEARTDTPDTERVAEETAQAVETADSGPRNTSESAEADESAEAADAEGVGIPKQQSAGEVVDNEADKGART
ncbi:hypothetical protein [Streptomyces sp. AC602_WCS936]|uniref:hypothetical protein n=1 Tax=Streptomyces sp. AC602_WCS936 TaxID=2823685 RepID=UPI001C25E4A4|nr:hypothetical protein [Streptomyces sp. AC602_WCS936]